MKITATATALTAVAALAAGTGAMAQTSLDVDISSGGVYTVEGETIQVQQGDNLVLEVFLRGGVAGASLVGPTSLVANASDSLDAINFVAGTSASPSDIGVFHGGTPFIDFDVDLYQLLTDDGDPGTNPAGQVDLLTNFFGVPTGTPGTLDSNGDGSLGTITIESSKLVAGQNFEVNFGGSGIEGLAPALALPGPSGNGVVTVNIVPEPTSLALLGLGGLLIVRRRR